MCIITNTGNQQRCADPAIDTYQIEIRALGSYAGGAGGSAAGTVLGTWSGASGSIPISIVNSTPVNVSGSISGTWMSSNVDENTLPEDIEFCVRVTDGCGVSDWVCSPVEVTPALPISDVTATINGTTNSTHQGFNILLGGWKDLNGVKQQLSAANGDLLNVQVIAQMNTVVAEADLIIGQDLTTPAGVANDINNWLTPGTGIANFLVSATLFPGQLVNTAVGTGFDKRGFAIANGLIGADLGSDYTIHVTTKCGVTGLNSPVTNDTMQKLYGLTSFNLLAWSSASSGPCSASQRGPAMTSRIEDSFEGNINISGNTLFFVDGESDFNGAGFTPHAVQLTGTYGAYCGQFSSFTGYVYGRVPIGTNTGQIPWVQGTPPGSWMGYYRAQWVGTSYNFTRHVSDAVDMPNYLLTPSLNGKHSIRIYTGIGNSSSIDNNQVNYANTANITSAYRDLPLGGEAEAGMQRDWANPPKTGNSVNNNYSTPVVMQDEGWIETICANTWNGGIDAEAYGAYWVYAYSW